MTEPLKVYSDTPAERRSMVLRDVLVVALLLLFAWTGTRVYGLVDGLQVLGAGIESAGEAVRSGFGSAAEAVGGVPVVGAPLSDGLRAAGDATGGSVADLGRLGMSSVHRVALALGWATAVLPSIVLLVVVVPRRLRRMRELGAAATVLVDLADPRRRHLLATRAVLGLPYRTLAQYTHDPLGDLLDGRYDALVAAALDEAGVRPAP